MKYKYAKHHIDDEDIETVIDVLKNKNLTQGEYSLMFESKLSKYLGSKRVVVCSSGTSALHLIYSALGLGKGSSLLTTPITFLATANAAKMTGANVLFADVDPITGLISKDNVINILKNKENNVKVLSITHLGSKICDLEFFRDVAKEYKIKLVEDACHVLGYKYFSRDNVPSLVGSGSYSIAASFSFHAIKNITTGEGGAISTNDDQLADKISLLRSHGTERMKYWDNNIGPWYYTAKVLGYNYRMTDFQAALGISQLNKIDRLNSKKRILAKQYSSLLADVDGISLPKIEEKKFNQTWHLYSIGINFKKFKIKKSQLMKKLIDKNIETQVHYIPLYKQPIYKNDNKFMGAEKYYESTLSLPMHYELNSDDIIHIVKNLKNILYNN